jgi:hypothetical protein
MFIFETPQGIDPNAPSTIRAGTAVQILPVAMDTGSILQVKGWGDFADQQEVGENEMKAIFTGIRISNATNHQIQHTLGNRIYLTVFGDRVSQLNLSGIAFFDNCNRPSWESRGLQNATRGIANKAQIGMARVIQWYQNHKLSNKFGPITVTIDPLTIYQCFLESLQGEMVGQESTAYRLFQFNMQLVAVATVFDLGGTP